MKNWQVGVIVLLLVSLPLLSSCQLLGIGGKSKEQSNYEMQIEVMQKNQEAAQQAQDEYYQQLQQALNDYMKQYNDYTQAQQQQTLQAIQQAAQDNQQEAIPYN